MEVKVHGEPVEDSDKKKEKPDDWQIESWCRTLVEAEEIKADPKKMKYVSKQIQKQKKALSKITSTDGLRAKANEMDKED